MVTTADFVAALNRRDRSAAVDAANGLLAANAVLGDQWQAVARFAVRVAEWPLAIAAMRRFVARKPDDLERILQLADILANAGRIADAISLLAPLVTTAPQDARLHHLMGTAYLQMGDTEQGLHHLHAAARIWPASGMTWLAIANARRLTVQDPAWTPLMAADRATQGTLPAARGAYLYAAGKAWDDVGDHDRAFAAFEQGARLLRQERAWDPEPDEVEARALVGSLDKAWLDRAALPDQASTGPIFVTGLPRSGTTLIDQILASHSRVTSGGELNLLEIAMDDAGGTSAERIRHRFLANPTPEQAWGRIGPAYAHLTQQRGIEGTRFVDKSLDTSRYAGLIRVAMPDARIVWVRRDPIDTAWSCFRTFFSQGLGWTFSLDMIGRHFAVEDMLFDHWRSTLGARLLVVPYEALVEDIGAWVPRIAAHVGLAFEPAMLDFHRLKRPVATASVAQVREPLYRRAIGAAAPYAARMTPFVEAYERSRVALAAGS